MSVYQESDNSDNHTFTILVYFVKTDNGYVQQLEEIKIKDWHQKYISFY